MKKLMIRGDQLLLALRCFAFLETCAQFGDTELVLGLGLRVLNEADLWHATESKKYNSHCFSLQKCQEIFQEKGLLACEQRPGLDVVLSEYGWYLGVLHDFMEANIQKLASAELDLSGNTSYLIDRSVNGWVQRFLQLFASGEITEEMLK